MPHFTVESTYRLPVYRQRSYEASDLPEACRMAIEDGDWENAKRDHEAGGETYVTGIWAVQDAPHRGEPLPIPSQFDETVQRKADHFDELLKQLGYAATPMGLSYADFGRWLPGARAAVEKAKAIIEGRRDPDPA